MRGGWGVNPHSHLNTEHYSQLSNDILKIFFPWVSKKHFYGKLFADLLGLYKV